MASTYSDLKIELIGTGEQSGTWGDTTNTNLGTTLEEAIVGRANADFVSDADLTLTLTNTNASQVARHFILNVTSSVALTVTRNLIVPTIDKPYIIENNTTGSQSIVVKTAAGSGVTVPNGKTVIVYANSTNVVSAISHIPALTLSTDLAVADGGTGASDAAGARTNLGLGTIATQAANNVAITGGSIAGITDLAVADGGTGASDAATARTNLGIDTNFVSKTSSTGSAQLPASTTANRDGTPAAGYLRFNTTLNQFEGYNGTSWGAVGGVSDGDKGDITVSGSGGIWTIDNNVVTPAKLTAEAKTDRLASITATQASGALTFTVNPCVLDFRSTTLTSGVPQTVSVSTSVSLVLPSGGTLGFPTTVAGRIIVVLMANGEPAIISIAGGNSLDETGLIDTTAISASSTAKNVFYSTTARTNQPYRVVGAVDVVNTAGAWGNPTLVQPYGGNALAAIGGFLSSANGYQKLPSGLIIQWGTTGSISAGGTLLVAIPVAFTTANLSAVCMAQYSSAPNAGFMVSIFARTLTNMSFYNSNAGVALTATWFAIGY